MLTNSTMFLRAKNKKRKYLTNGKALQNTDQETFFAVMEGKAPKPSAQCAAAVMKRNRKLGCTAGGIHYQSKQGISRMFSREMQVHSKLFSFFPFSLYTSMSLLTISCLIKPSCQAQLLLLADWGPPISWIKLCLCCWRLSLAFHICS